MEIGKLIHHHIKKRPLMEVRDVYKLLFQGVFGVGHIMGESAWDRLREEASKIDLRDHPEESIIEEISTNGKMLRVNLRPFLKEGLYLEALYQAMIESESQGDPEELRRYWGNFVEMIEKGALNFPIKDVKDIQLELKQSQPKPMHHTRQYREAYYPAYRVVERGALEKHLQGLVDA